MGTWKREKLAKNFKPPGESNIIFEAWQMKLGRNEYIYQEPASLNLEGKLCYGISHW